MKQLVMVPMALLCLVVAACSSSDKQGPPTAEQQREGVLSELSMLLRTAVGPQNKGPQKVADLAPFANGAPIAYDAVKKGDIVVIWGVPLPGEGEAAQAGDAIVAYEKATPDSGGYVLLLNGQVKKLTAQEFTTAPKAK